MMWIWLSLSFVAGFLFSIWWIGRAMGDLHEEVARYEALFDQTDGNPVLGSRRRAASRESLKARGVVIVSEPDRAYWFDRHGGSA